MTCKHAMLTLLLTGLATAAFAAGGSPVSRPGLQSLTDSRGKKLKATIHYVGENYIYLQRYQNTLSRIERSELDAASLKRVDEWKTAYQDDITPEEFKKIIRAATSRSQPLIIDPDPSKQWTMDKNFSDEFNSRKIDESKWNNNVRPWGERSWSADNLWLEKGSLFIQARYEPHTDRRGNNNYFYKLGILQSKKKTTYGYFEARIKGCSRFPGLCPAFWLYSNGREKNPDYPDITYCEIDIVEMLQGGYDTVTKSKTGPNHIDCNLHTREMIDGVETWRRPQHWPEVCRNSYSAPWDPRDDFHTYACENTPETVTWYIDGVKVAESPNHNWHLPMNIALTMELRPPLIAWAGVDGREPVAAASTPDGFPTHMEVDYVRSWTRE